MPSEVIVLFQPENRDEKEKNKNYFFGVPLIKNLSSLFSLFLLVGVLLFWFEEEEVHRERKVHRAAFPFIDGTLRYNRYSFGFSLQRIDSLIVWRS